MTTDFFRATEVTDDIDRQVEDCFNYHQWDSARTSRGAAVRRAIADAVKVIIANVPPCPTRDVAIRKLIEARMDCNAAITHDGRY